MEQNSITNTESTFLLNGIAHLFKIVKEFEILKAKICIDYLDSKKRFTNVSAEIKIQ